MGAIFLKCVSITAFESYTCKKSSLLDERVDAEAVGFDALNRV